MANATADNLLDDLKLTQADYNLGNTLSKLGCEFESCDLSLVSPTPFAPFFR